MSDIDYCVPTKPRLVDGTIWIVEHPGHWSEELEARVQLDVITLA